MNALSPVPQFPPDSDAAQFNSSSGSNSSSGDVVAQNFSSALQVANGKPGRKSAARSGSQLPACGNSAPTSVPPGPTLVGTPAIPIAAPPAPAPTPAVAATNTAAAAGKVAAPFPPVAGQDAASPPAAPPTVVLPLDIPSVPVCVSPAAMPVISASAAAASGAVPAAVSAAGDRPGLPARALPRTAAPAVGAGAQLTHTTQNTRADPIAGDATATSSSDAISATDPTAQTVMATAAAARAANAPSDAPDDAAMPAIDPTPAAAVTPAVMPPIVAALADSRATANLRSVIALAAVNPGAPEKLAHGNGADPSSSAPSNDDSAGAVQLLTSNTTPDTSSATIFKIAAPVETAEFSQGVADRVSFMVDGNISSAKLQVNPPALGPIEVRIALQGAHAQVTFTSHSALTRDALQSSVPKLREMLGAQGFGQVSVDVSQGSFQDRSAQSSPYQLSNSQARDTGVVAAQSWVRTGPTAATGVIDAYA